MAIWYICVHEFIAELGFKPVAGHPALAPAGAFVACERIIATLLGMLRYNIIQGIRSTGRKTGPTLWNRAVLASLWAALAERAKSLPREQRGVSPDRRRGPMG